MAITFLSAGAIGTGGSPLAAVPASYVSGGLMVIVCTGSESFATPSGWTAAAGNNTSNPYISLFYKVAKSSESNVTLIGGGLPAVAVMLAYSNTNSIDVSGNIKTGSSTTAQPNTLVTTKENDLIISVYGVATAAASLTLTTPSGTNLRAIKDSDTNTQALLVVDEIKSSPGTTTARQSQLSIARGWASFAVSFMEKTDNFFIMF